MNSVPTLKEAATLLLERIEHAEKHYHGKLVLAGAKDEIDALREAVLLEDRRTKFEILLNNGTKKKVAGYVVGPFGIHKGDGWWTVTHVPTGYTVCRSPFAKKTQAITYAEAILPLADWAGVNQQTPVFPAEVVQQIRDLERASHGDTSF